MRPSPHVAALFGLFLGAGARAQQAPPVHLIDRPVAETRHELGASVQVRQLPNKRLLINDPAHRRLILVDSMLGSAAVVADTTTGGVNTYGAGGGTLISYVADSNLFILPRVPAMYVIDPAGAIARVTAVPRPQDVGSLAAATFGTPGFDAKGRLIYRGSPPPMHRDTVVLGGPPGNIASADTAPLVRYDLASHTLDTVAQFRLRGYRGQVIARPGGGTISVIQSNPLTMLDEWAVASDGSVVILRGQDYHFDVFGPDGTMTKWPKMTFAWEHMSDDAKVALIDSVKAANERPDTTRRSLTQGNAAGSGAGGGGGGGLGGDRAADEELIKNMPRVVSADVLPDYRPPFDQGALRPDADGNLWIRTTQPGKFGAGAMYDVVRQGKVIDHVQLQPGRAVIGFGRGGVVYVLATQTGGSWIEKSMWSAPK